MLYRKLLLIRQVEFCHSSAEGQKQYFVLLDNCPDGTTATELVHASSSIGVEFQSSK